MLSIKQLDSDEVSSWLGRSVEITGVTISTLVQILLEGIEEVLHAPIQLNLQMLVQYELIVQLHIEIEEIRSMLQLILHYIGIREISRDFIGRSEMWHIHTTGIYTRQ